MTPSEVNAEITNRLVSIMATKHDPEVAHGIEDALYVFVLMEIANNPLLTLDDMRTAANGALESREIAFPRWTA